MAIMHTLTFPGLFAPGGLLGAGPQSTAWLYIFWHGGFPLAAIGYGLCEKLSGRVIAGTSPPALLPWALGAVAVAVTGLTLLATAGKALLPDLLTGGITNNAWLAGAVSADL